MATIKGKVGAAAAVEGGVLKADGGPAHGSFGLKAGPVLHFDISRDLKKTGHFQVRPYGGYQGFWAANRSGAAGFKLGADFHLSAALSEKISLGGRLGGAYGLLSAKELHIPMSFGNQSGPASGGINSGSDPMAFKRLSIGLVEVGAVTSYALGDRLSLEASASYRLSGAAGRFLASEGVFALGLSYYFGKAKKPSASPPVKRAPVNQKTPDQSESIILGLDEVETGLEAIKAAINESRLQSAMQSLMKGEFVLAEEQVGDYADESLILEKYTIVEEQLASLKEEITSLSAEDPQKEIFEGEYKGLRARLLKNQAFIKTLKSYLKIFTRLRELQDRINKLPRSEKSRLTKLLKSEVLKNEVIENEVLFEAAFNEVFIKVKEAESIPPQKAPRLPAVKQADPVDDNEIPNTGKYQKITADGEDGEIIIDGEESEAEPSTPEEYRQGLVRDKEELEVSQ